MSTTILENSSQPYLYSIDNQQQLLYCFANNTVQLVYGNPYLIRPWKIRHINLFTNISFEINTPRSHTEHGNVVLECNPHISIVDDVVRLNYVAGFNKGDNHPIHYFLSYVRFTDLTFQTPIDTQINLLKNTFTGYCYDNIIIYNSQQKFDGKLVKENINTGEQTIIDLSSIGFTSILRVSKIYNNNYFIITGQKIDNSFASVLVDQNFVFIKTILNANNENIYKCTLLNNHLIYTIREESSEEIEKRSLVQEEYHI